MAIEIIQEPTIKLTAEEYQKYHAEYQNAFLYYSGMPPTFEQWVRRKLEETRSQNEQLILG